MNDDAAAICSIYNHYIENTVVSFEEVPLAIEDMRQRIDDVLTRYPWFVTEVDGVILGYAYASGWRPRASFRHTAESSIYLHPDAVGRGLGTELYRILIDELRARKFHCVMGGMSLPNDASRALHKKLGYRKVAEFKEVGHKFGRWIDTENWQLMLENQSGEKV